MHCATLFPLLVELVIEKFVEAVRIEVEEAQQKDVLWRAQHALAYARPISTFQHGATMSSTSWPTHDAVPVQA